MATKFRGAIIGFAHMHINYLAAQFAQHPQVEMVAMADTIPAIPELREGPHTRGWNMRYAEKNFGISKVYEDYRELLLREKPDLVVSCAENAQHAEVAEAAAAAGAHIIFEKPMASSLAHALRMARAARQAGTQVVINWPLSWDPATRKAKALVDAGQIGRILQLKWRGAHTGPLGPGATHPGVRDEAAPLSTSELAATWWHHDSAGGGAFLDYCCYGCMLSRWFIGEQAQAVIGLRGNLNSPWCDTDDNGVMVARFPSAMAISEASWTTVAHGVPYGPIIYGQSGTLVLESRDGKRIVRLERGGDRTEIFEPEPLPKMGDDVAKQFIHHLESGQPLHPTVEMEYNLEVMAILDAGYRSAGSGKLEVVDNAAWRLGAAGA